MARLLKVSASELQSEADAGRVPHIRIGENYLFNPQAVFSVLADRAAREGLRADAGERELAHA